MCFFLNYLFLLQHDSRGRDYRMVVVGGAVQCKSAIPEEQEIKNEWMDEETKQC